MSWLKKKDLKKQEISDKLLSLDLAFTLTKELIASQLEDVNALDTKASFALGSGTAVVSAALVLQSLLLPSHPHLSCSIFIPNFLSFLRLLPPLLKKSLSLFPLLFTYFLVVFSSSNAYKTRDYKRVPKPRSFLDNLDKTEQECKNEMFPEMVAAYEWNQKEAEKKAKWIDYLVNALKSWQLLPERASICPEE